MIDLANKHVLVVGLGYRGRATCEFLHRSGAQVQGVDPYDTPTLRAAVAPLQAAGVPVQLGATTLPARWFDFAVISAAVPRDVALVQALRHANVPVLGELELGLRQTNCLNVAVTGTNGKATTAGMIERILAAAGRKTLVAGHAGRPLCSVIEQTKELDYLILQLSAPQLERAEALHASVAVLLNTARDFPERFATTDDYVRAQARVFANQHPFDWAVVQHAALARLHAVGVKLRAKTITFSASDEAADLYFDRGLLVSRLDDWAGPLLNMDQCRIAGPHNAENLMAALAVGRALRLPLEGMVAALQEFTPGPHCFARVAAFNDVEFINDSKATNLAALEKALLAARPGPGGQANVWLIAGGVDRGESFHDLGPLIARRVKAAFLLGEDSEKVRAAWSLFTPCTPVGSLLEAVSEAAKIASAGDVILLSPACSSFDQFRDYQERGEEFCAAVKTISRGGTGSHPKGNGDL